jgi:D-tyrosyl-tRNA(Tyr) deacylase
MWRPARARHAGGREQAQHLTLSVYGSGGAPRQRLASSAPPSRIPPVRATRGRAQEALAHVRALVQRVSSASVSVDRGVVAAIGPGLLVLLGVAREDDVPAAQRLAHKVRALRVFDDAQGRMNEALGEREILCVSQFTLYGELRRGNRPSFAAAAPAEQAEPLYERFCALVGAKRGIFGARMAVELVNDGPVTLLLET